MGIFISVAAALIAVTQKQSNPWIFVGFSFLGLMIAAYAVVRSKKMSLTYVLLIFGIITFLLLYNYLRYIA